MSSNTASSRQPVPAHPHRLHTFEDYTTTEGKRALSVEIDIRDVGRFYAEDRRLSGSYSDDWATATSRYIPRRIHNAGDALDAMQSFEFPADLRRDAQRAARCLSDVFEQAARLQVLRDKTAGRLDRRKYPRIARDLAAGTYDATRVRPYRRTEPTPAVKPRIAIIASAAWGEMWADDSYIPRVAVLTLALTWACQAADLEPSAYLVMGHSPFPLRRSSIYAEAVLGVQLAGPDTTISPRAYGVALHRDLWRYGYIALGAANYEGLKRLMTLRGDGIGRRSAGTAFPCGNGGHAVHWARTVQSADVVIAIGNILDRDDAEVQLGSKFTLDEAVATIARQMQKA